VQNELTTQIMFYVIVVSIEKMNVKRWGGDFPLLLLYIFFNFKVKIRFFLCFFFGIFFCFLIIFFDYYFSFLVVWHSFVNMGKNLIRIFFLS
jgi:hypothetical protein